MALLGETGLGGLEGGFKEGIAIGGEDELPGLEVEGEDADMLLRDLEAIDNGIGDVLVLHRLEHMGDDGLAGGIVMEKMIARLRTGEDDGSSLFGELLLVGLGVVEELGGGSSGKTAAGERGGSGKGAAGERGGSGKGAAGERDGSGKGAAGERGYQALAVAYHPDFAAQTAVDDAGGGEALLWML